MRLPRFRFTIGQLTKLIACLAILFGLVRLLGWPLILAIGPVILGFAIDRAKGRPGILGSMLAGAIEFVGVALLALLEYSGYAAFPGILVVLVGAVFLGALGLALGLFVGSCLWMIALILGMGPGVEPLPSELVGPIN